MWKDKGVFTIKKLFKYSHNERPDFIQKKSKIVDIKLILGVTDKTIEAITIIETKSGHQFVSGGHDCWRLRPSVNVWPDCIEQQLCLPRH